MGSENSKQRTSNTSSSKKTTSSQSNLHVTTDSSFARKRTGKRALDKALNGIASRSRGLSDDSSSTNQPSLPSPASSVTQQGSSTSVRSGSCGDALPPLAPKRVHQQQQPFPLRLRDEVDEVEKGTRRSRGLRQREGNDEDDDDPPTTDSSCSVTIVEEGSTCTRKKQVTAPPQQHRGEAPPPSLLVLKHRQRVDSPSEEGRSSNDESSEMSSDLSSASSSRVVRLKRRSAV